MGWPQPADPDDIPNHGPDPLHDLLDFGINPVHVHLGKADCCFAPRQTTDTLVTLCIVDFAVAFNIVSALLDCHNSIDRCEPPVTKSIDLLFSTRLKDPSVFCQRCPFLDLAPTIQRANKQLFDLCSAAVASFFHLILFIELRIAFIAPLSPPVSLQGPLVTARQPPSSRQTSTPFLRFLVFPRGTSPICCFFSATASLSVAFGRHCTQYSHQKLPELTDKRSFRDHHSNLPTTTKGSAS